MSFFLCKSNLYYPIVHIGFCLHHITIIMDCHSQTKKTRFSKPCHLYVFHIIFHEKAILFLKPFHMTLCIRLFSLPLMSSATAVIIINQVFKNFSIYSRFKFCVCCSWEHIYVILSVCRNISIHCPNNALSHHQVKRQLPLL